MYKVSIVVPCAQELLYIEKCIDSILSLDFTGIEDYEILIADGMSSDGTREIVGRMALVNPRIKLIDNPAIVTAAGLNQGIREARFDFIVRCDAHSEYASDYLLRGLQALLISGSDVAGGPWIAEGRSTKSKAIAAVFQNGLFALGAKAHDNSYSGSADTVYLGFYHRKTFALFGEFDEKILRNEDDEFNFRVALLGGKIWLSSSIKSKYFVREFYRKLIRQYQQYGYWKLAIFVKHGRFARHRHYIPILGLAFVGFGFVSALFFHKSLLFIGIVVGLYLFYGFTVSSLLAWKQRQGNLLWYWWPMSLMQIAYCLGMWLALLDKYVLRRYPRKSFYRLTR